MEMQPLHGLNVNFQILFIRFQANQYRIGPQTIVHEQLPNETHPNSISSL
jgi:hypothetical protein